MLGKLELEGLKDIANMNIPQEQGMCGECVNFPRNSYAGASNMICPNGGIVSEYSVCSCPYFSRQIYG